ncbi:DNA topoisomerase [Taxawa tesnikishii (nom. ined.)]|nr:DNA topoisomerase [Dothideales sp. JES 119]
MPLNYEFQFNFPTWGPCDVIMTSVAGHLNSQDFDSAYKSWSSCDPGQLFEARIVTYVDNDKKAIAKNIETQAVGARALFIWTDCDREGEHIGTEIRSVAVAKNPRLRDNVVRARFSNIERLHVIQAAKNPITIDENQANAVAARIELDLRIGASFTRMQTLSLRPFSSKEALTKSEFSAMAVVNFQPLGLLWTSTFGSRISFPNHSGISKSCMPKMTSTSHSTGTETTSSIE